MYNRTTFAIKCALDETLRALRMRDVDIPPLRLVRVSPYSTFRKAGEEWKNKLISVGGLQPEYKMLDIGCGTGRVSLALMDYVSDVGSYDGIDIRADEIKWLRKTLSKKRSNFTFHHADLFNEFYHLSGTVDPSEYVFPFKDESFEFIFLTSIFTHLLPKELEHYLKEINRMLMPDGHSFASYFLLSADARRNIQAKSSSREFVHQIEPSCFSDNINVPEEAVAYEEEFILGLYQKYSFTIKNRFQGRWSFDPQLNATEDYQDIIVARKGSASKLM